MVRRARMTTVGQPSTSAVERILCPVDRTDFSPPALAHAAALASPWRRNRASRFQRVMPPLQELLRHEGRSRSRVRHRPPRRVPTLGGRRSSLLNSSASATTVARWRSGSNTSAVPSIPGMCAKPVLDIAAGLPGDAPILEYVAALAHAGYEHRGERGVPGRHYFRRGEPRTYHVHLVEVSGPLWRDYIAFRDYLRSHAEAARQFADVKRALAARFSRDREAYMNAKSLEVQEILRLVNGAG